MLERKEQAVTFPEDETTELKCHCEELSQYEEASITYLLLKKLLLPVGCLPATCDALLVPNGRDGYLSRLFFEQRIQPASPRVLNWNAQGIRVIERNWQAFSWQVTRANLRLPELLVAHLKGLT